ncbi:lipopolysaccharide biosynthesis protein [Myroides odoratimimus]|uniref:lipopolysaccharide biosynthesis protein n=2 Tax=Myroides odoratimimus TaxID=76832 RepID=UPI002577248B|nr:lipopolysaccharide biosynthesis protein [Myroides odoratimimus]MDM1506888.1 lipopolysaccharide biosynthesis protein [Myroides odoratimimus]MDM1537760.1 lipopolysaccharide biosynthesis protein [Myroides odoratimimus]MDM1677313.1 lipopolysaccharide biosynthesis protein [Myroides odoratimimus]MDM1680394.1 lipopolysaccharide biosynthesis protein [Myroides odoratimimus]
MKDINSKFKNGLIWSVFGQFGYLFITLLTNVLLARLLSPKEFGVVAIATFFIAMSKVLTESGLSGALIRKTNATEIDNSTIFIFNLSVSVGLYLILFFFSPIIEVYYEIDNLSIYLRVLGTILIINSFQIIQNVRLIKQLRYKAISLYTLISVIISSIIAIIIAFLGYGVWSLILLQVLNVLFLTIIYWIKEQGLTVYKFSIESFKELYGFGLYTTLSSLLNTGFDNIYQLILGKYFNLGQTGFYFQAKKLSEIPVGVIKSTTLGVVFSALSNIQDDKEKFDQMYNNVVRIFTVVVGLICMGLFLYSRELLYILYGEKWLDAEFYMKIIALASFFYMQEMFNRVLFKVFNQTKKIFTLEIIKKCINIVSLILGVYYKSLEVLMYGYLITCVVSYFINYYTSRKVYQSYAVYKELIYTLKVVLTISIIMGIYYTMSSLVSLTFLESLYSIPFVIGFYTVVLQQLNVISIKKDLKFIKNIKK